MAWDWDWGCSWFSCWIPFFRVGQAGLRQVGLRQPGYPESLISIIWGIDLKSCRNDMETGVVWWFIGCLL